MSDHAIVVSAGNVDHMKKKEIIIIVKDIILM